MKEIVYQWVKNLAVFYILLTAVLHLMPDKKYDRYVRHFMGLLLIVMMSAPVFMLLGKSGKIIESFQMNFNQENKKREEREVENLQMIYLRKGYAAELQKKIIESLKNFGIEVLDVKVNIEGEKFKAVITVDKETTGEQKGRIADDLRAKWGFREGEYSIQTKEDDSQAVDHSASVGVTVGSGSPACG